MAMAAPSLFLLATLFLSILFLSSAAEQNNAFHFIEHLAGSQKGQYVKGITELKKYLKEFGYLSFNQQENDLFDDALESAIKGYQLNFHMKATGKMDDHTVKQMMIPRCGIADQKSRQRPYSKTDLTYKFNSGALISIGEINIRSIFAQAFQKWADVTDFTFEEVPGNSPADMEIKFRSGRHGDDSPFDGAGGVFGHVRLPETGGKSLEIHLDADEKWSNNLGMAKTGIDLESVAIHEIGHLLGVDHNTGTPDAVMHPGIEYGMVKRHLHQDDIRAVRRALYGLK